MKPLKGGIMMRIYKKIIFATLFIIVSGVVVLFPLVSVNADGDMPTVITVFFA